jgi:DNA mismatch endonuclease, patch repair protein
MSSARPYPSSPGVSERMSRLGRRDTAPELALRSELHRRGLRFRVDQRIVPAVRTRPDVAFPRAKVAVFVDGCFWHACPEHQTWPAANRTWWRQKLEENVRRDQRTNDALAAEGWLVIRVWEHEPPAQAAERVEHAVRSRGR